MFQPRTTLLALLGILTVLPACGPRISEVRIVPVPSRAADCPLEFIKLDMMDLSSPTGTWQMIGNVLLGDTGKLDPFDEKNKTLVRSRACAMGGEGVSIMMTATNEGLVTDGSRITYAILKHRTAEVEAPKAF